MKYLSLILITLMFSNCEGTKNVQENNPNAPFETIEQSAYGGKENQSYEIIRSKADLQKELAGLQLEEKAMNQLRAIDFNNQIVLALHAGTHNTGGFGIEVANVEINGTTSYVTVNKTTPKPGEPVTMALTNPYTIVLIDKNETIVFK
jgi:hypothetical protein